MEQLLTKLAELNISLAAEGEGLDIYDPDNNLTKDLLEEVKSHKTTLLSLLKNTLKDSYRPLPIAAAKPYYQLSAEQRRLFFLYEFDKLSLAYNMPHVVKLLGMLDKEKLQSNFRKLVIRHESLRTSFLMHQDRPVQCISDASELVVEYYSADETSVDTAINNFIRPFELNTAPLIRVALIEMMPQEHILMVDMHHIISDGVSQGILMRDFLALYGQHDLQPLRLQYKDFAEWQRMEQQQEEVAKQKRFWLNEFKETVEVLALPTDLPRPLLKSYEGATSRFNFDAETTQRLRDLAKKQGLTMYMLLLAIYNILISKISNQEDIVIGTPVAGRQHPDLKEIIGMFVNTLPLRNFPRGEISIQAFFEEVKIRTLQAFSHQSVQYDELVELLQVKRDASRNPLFDVMFTYENFDLPVFKLPGLEVLPYHPSHPISKFDLTLTAEEHNHELIFYFEYATALFRKSTIERFIGYFKNIVHAVLDNIHACISSVEVLGSKEKECLVHTFNEPSINLIQQESVVTSFLKQVKDNPKGIALIDDLEELTYEQLDARANNVANLINDRLKGRGHHIGLFFEPSVDMVASMLGVLKTGNAYVPLAPQAPFERNKYIIQDSGMHLMLMQQKLGDNLPQDLIALDKQLIIGDKCRGECTFEAEDIDLDDVMYIIYTSGTSGWPKGVSVRHRGVANFIQWRIANYRFSKEDVTLQLLSHQFDGFASNLYASILSGGTLILVGAENRQRSGYLAELIVTHKVTTSVMTPGLYALVLRELEEVAHYGILNCVVLAGEKANPDVLRQSSRLLPDTKVHNEYGPTEASIGATFHPDLNAQNTDIIGKPISNIAVYVLGKYDELLPLGVYGELCISGAGTAKGYIGNKELTDNKFVQDPFRKGLRMYRSGDLVRWLPNGTLQFKGRIDKQVKIRGYRIELGEIEKQLIECPELKQALVLRKDYHFETYLVAYYVSPIQANPEQIRQYLAEKVPDYMVPAYFIRLEELPLTINGKVDENALPEPNYHEIETVVGPSNNIEVELVEIWAETLSISKESISVVRSFFEQGGNSLSAMLLINKLRKVLKVDVSLQTLFQFQDIRSLAKHMQAAKAHKYQPIEKTPDRNFYQISSAQARLYFLHQYNPESLAYNMPQVVKLKGAIDYDKLKETFQRLITRHESLRTFLEIIDEETVQKVAEDVALSIEHFQCKEADADRVIKSFIKPFDLNKPPLLRIGLIKFDATEHLLMVDMHHIIADGMSQTILIKDFMALYEDKEVPALPLQYKDYVAWQRSDEQNEVVYRQKQFWLHEFREIPPVLDIPTDFLRPKQPSYSGDSKYFNLTVEETKQLKELAEEEEATLFMVILSLYLVLLSRLSGQDDIVVGVPVAGRQHPDLEKMIGMFVNTLPMRFAVPGNIEFRQFLKIVKEKTLSYLEKQSFPYEELIDELNIERNSGRNPLFDTMFSFENFEDFTLQIPELILQPYPDNNKVAKFDLSLTAVFDNDQLLFNLNYALDLFEGQTIEKFISYFKKVAAEVISKRFSAISSFDLLTAQEKYQIAEIFNGTKVDYPVSKTIIDLFEENLSNHSDDVAVVFNGQEVSYLELSEKVNGLVHTMYKNNVHKKDRIIVLIDHSLELLVAMMAIMKCGATFVPVDVNWPQSRKENALELTDASLVLYADEASVKGLTVENKLLLQYDEISRISEIEGARIDEDDAIYIIFTSGSTGKPKGVEVPYKGVMNRLFWMNDFFGKEAAASVLQTTRYVYDSVVWQFFWPLINCGKIIILPPHFEMTDDQLVSLVEKHQVRLIDFVPSVFNTLFQKSEDAIDKVKAKLKSLQYIILGGEEISEKITRRFMELHPTVQIINLYGPTEASIGCIYHEVKQKATGKIPIGKPISNTQIWILDRYERQVPLGSAGEICISGDCLAKGYLKDKEKNTDSFKFIDEIQKRVYKTGDQAYRDKTGDIFFLGRLDDQVKIRGFRIEVKEIENHLLLHGAVKEASVQTRAIMEDKCLVAYYIAERNIEGQELKTFLAEHLPNHMIPSFFISMEQFPLTPGGKLNKKAFPEPELKAVDEHQRPVNQMQTDLRKIWAKVLGVDEEVIGVNVNFFDIGGNSLRLLPLVDRINQNYGADLSVAKLFEYSTIENMEKLLKNSPTTSTTEEEVDIKEISGVVNLFDLDTNP